MAVASKWLEATFTGHKRWTERLYSLQLVADGPAFQAGQFAKLALEIDGEMVARPYSFVNAPGTQPHEFYYITWGYRPSAYSRGCGLWYGVAGEGYIGGDCWSGVDKRRGGNSGFSNSSRGNNSRIHNLWHMD